MALDNPPARTQIEWEKRAGALGHGRAGYE
jgi:hypothetical protein